MVNYWKQNKLFRGDIELEKNEIFYGVYIVPSIMYVIFQNTRK